MTRIRLRDAQRGMLARLALALDAGELRVFVCKGCGTTMLNLPDRPHFRRHYCLRQRCGWRRRAGCPAPPLAALPRPANPRSPRAVTALDVARLALDLALPAALAPPTRILRAGTPGGTP